MGVLLDGSQVATIVTAYLAPGPGYEIHQEAYLWAFPVGMAGSFTASLTIYY